MEFSKSMVGAPTAAVPSPRVTLDVGRGVMTSIWYRLPSPEPTITMLEPGT